MTTINSTPFSNIILNTLPQVDPKATPLKPADPSAFLDSLASAFGAGGWSVPKAAAQAVQGATDALAAGRASVKAAAAEATVAPAVIESAVNAVKQQVSTSTVDLKSQLASAASVSNSTLAYANPGNGVANLLKELGVG